eukprot:403371838
MEEDLEQLSNEDLKLLYDTFTIVRSGDYPGSEVQMGFKLLFNEADKNGDGLVERDNEFIQLMRGYFNSRHIKPSQVDYDLVFKKIDLNSDGKISFEEYDIFVRMIYETEYLPALEREIKRRKLLLQQQQPSSTTVNQYGSSNQQQYGVSLQNGARQTPKTGKNKQQSNNSLERNGILKKK